MTDAVAAVPPSMHVLVVIPTYEEAENVDEVLRRVRSATPDADVLVVDDDSPDGTADLADAVGRELGSVEVLRKPREGGLGAAYRAGFDWGLERGYDVLVEMDADLSHEPEALPSLLHGVTLGADLVIGSRYVVGGSIPNWPWHRRALSRWGNVYASKILGLSVRDSTSGFRAFRAETLADADYQSTEATGYAFQIELVYRATRLRSDVIEVPIVFRDRVRGRSKMSPRIALEAMALVSWWGIRERLFRRPRWTPSRPRAPTRREHGRP
jgi:dolichol-phosphate mannosyltransferase